MLNINTIDIKYDITSKALLKSPYIKLIKLTTEN